MPGVVRIAVRDERLILDLADAFAQAGIFRVVIVDHERLHPRERERFARLVALGYADAFRLFEQPAGLYSWWDYRQLAFPRNAGLRIDHIMVAEALAPRVRECRIDREARKGKQPSDHAPVIADIEPGGASG